MAFAVVERFKHESPYAECPPGQKRSCCGELAFSGGSTVYIHLTLNGHLFKTDTLLKRTAIVVPCLPFSFYLTLSKTHGHIERDSRLTESQIKGGAMKGTDQIQVSPLQRCGSYKRVHLREI